jgi:hypothetical protein
MTRSIHHKTQRHGAQGKQDTFNANHQAHQGHQEERDKHEFLGVLRARGGNHIGELWPQVWPILAFMTGVLALGLKVYRRTLD